MFALFLSMQVPKIKLKKTTTTTIKKLKYHKCCPNVHFCVNYFKISAFVNSFGARILV